MGNTRMTIEVEMDERWSRSFLEMLATMEMLGNVGATRIIAFNSDGCGEYRPRFKVNGQKLDRTNVTLMTQPSTREVDYFIDAE